jgi:murein DD-endopeptidase MepM/ murein hydrolase activator NlpD
MIRSNFEVPRVPDGYLDAPAVETGSQESAGAVQIAQNSPLTTWPVPGHGALNERDPGRGQGDGAFGAYRNHGGGSHTGIDITASEGTPVVAAGDGTIVRIQPNPSKTYGNQIVIEHPDGFYTQYGHLSRTDVVPGMAVRAGDPIGLSGTSGNLPRDKNGEVTADPHVHFEVRRGSMQPHSTGGQVVNPIDFLPMAP